MAKYISTIKFTEAGVQDISHSCKRAAEFKTEAKKLGVKVAEIYWTLGPVDGVIVFDAPDDATATAAMLRLSSHGSVHTTTSRAFDSAEMEKIIAKVAK
jgi:uncharacterized protein with GYD domain